jgi:hypothetical protein
MPIVNIQLTELISKFGTSTVIKLLADFCCKLDCDVEHFIRKKAVPFEVMDHSRTSLIIWVNETNDDYEILAYYSLASKSFCLDGLPRSTQKRIRGGDPLPSQKTNAVSSILIGQIGRNSNSSLHFPSEALFREIFVSIRAINCVIGTRIIYLECKDIPQLKSIYESKGFQLLKNPDGSPFLSSNDGHEYIVYIMTMKHLKQILSDNDL